MSKENYRRMGDYIREVDVRNRNFFLGGGTNDNNLRRFYCSDTYKRLSDETTKLWHYGPVALYQEFTDELKQKENE